MNEEDKRNSLTLAVPAEEVVKALDEVEKVAESGPKLTHATAGRPRVARGNRRPPTSVPTKEGPSIAKSDQSAPAVTAPAPEATPPEPTDYEVTTSVSALSEPAASVSTPSDAVSSHLSIIFN